MRRAISICRWLKSPWWKAFIIRWSRVGSSIGSVRAKASLKMPFESFVNSPHGLATQEKKKGQDHQLARGLCERQGRRRFRRRRSRP
jgi:hypothetical protein